MITIPKGTKDVLPQESYKWHYIEKKIRAITNIYQLQEIRTPTFEHTELFLRGVGDTTDIVNKEMYTFLDRGDRSITLKPEGTAGVARAFIENNLQQNVLPMRCWYQTPVFRYEKPQAGRLREHHQFGVEVYGAQSPESDAEVISIAKSLFDSLGLAPTLHINSIGCPACRANYHAALRGYLQANLTELCDTCKTRFDTNPLRILDCKNDKCARIVQGAPSILDYLCDDCRDHFQGVKHALDIMGVDYVVDSSIVRGLDYYTRTVFEFVADNIGAKSTVCGGGRYNHLIESIGGKPCPAVGFGMGIERLLLTLEAAGVEIENDELPLLYIASLGTNEYCMRLAARLRAQGISAACDIMGRGLKAQMKYADKAGFRYCVVLGEDEIRQGTAELKDLRHGLQQTVAIDDLASVLKSV